MESTFERLNRLQLSGNQMEQKKESVENTRYSGETNIWTGKNEVQKWTRCQEITGVNLNDVKLQIESILCLLLSDCNGCHVFPNILFLASWTARIGRFFSKSIYLLSVTSIDRTRPPVTLSTLQEGWNLIKMSTINRTKSEAYQKMKKKTKWIFRTFFFIEK